MKYILMTPTTTVSHQDTFKKICYEMKHPIKGEQDEVNMNSKELL